jgi:hypothetical protein
MMPSHRSTIEDDVARIEGESDFGGAKSYEWIRDVVLVCFNPPDDDAAEESILEDALARAAMFIEKQPCTCEDHGDQCDRCYALGRHGDQEIAR